MRPDQNHLEFENKLTAAVVAEVRAWRCVMPIRNQGDLERTLIEVGRYIASCSSKDEPEILNDD